MTGLENFKLWQGNLRVELAAVRLKKFLRAEICVAPVLKVDASPIEKKSFEAELEDWEFEHASALKIILQSVDSTHRIAIQSYRTAASAHYTLKSRYAMKDTALLTKFLSQLFAVQSMKNTRL